MVLTQREELEVLSESPSTCFHTTMVLTQHVRIYFVEAAE